MQMLKNRLYQIELNKQLAKKAELDANKSDVSFGSQIRSYVFQPYTMVNDHRTELKIPDVQKVMDGGIDPFIEAYLKQRGGERDRRAPRERRAELRPAGAPREARCARRRGRVAVRVRLRADARRAPRRSRRFRRAARNGPRRCAWPGGWSRGVATARRRSRISPTRSGRIQLYFRKDELGDDAVGAARRCYDIGDVVGVAGPLMRTRTGEVTVRVADGGDAGEVAAPAAVRQGRGGRRETVRHSGIRRSGAALPPAIRRPRRASGGARAVHRALAADHARSAPFSTGAGFSRWRRRCCSRCTAARRRGHSRRITTRSTCRSSCASRTSCISSASSSAASTACTRSATISGTRGSIARTIPSSRCWSSIRRTRTIAR